MPRVVRSPMDSIMPTVKCHEHPDNVYELYCEQHNDVLCVACKLIYHNKCGVENIHGLSTDVNAARLKHDSIGCMDDLWANLEKVKNDKKTELSQEEGAKSVALDEIEKFKKREVARIERITQRAVDQVELQDEKIKRKLKEEMHAVENKQREVEGFQIQIVDNKIENNCDSFIFDRLTSKMKNAVNDFTSSLHIGSTDFVSVEVPPSVSIPYPTIRSVPYKLEPIYKTEILDPKASCDLRDMCILDNGQVLLADFDNKCVHRLDCIYKMYYETCRIIDKCCLDGEPWGICSISPEKVAVTLCVTKKVCLLTVGSCMQVVKEFSVGEECRGIASKDGLLYVGCWSKQEPPKPGVIKVFDLNGNPYSKFDTNPATGKRLFNFITHLTISKDGKWIFVSDLSDGKHSGKGLMIIDINTGIEQNISDANELSGTFGLGNGELDEVIAGDRDKKVIYRLNDCGQIIQELHNELLEANPPQSVKYFRKHLVMTTRKSAKLLVFRIN